MNHWILLALGVGVAYAATANASEGTGNTGTGNGAGKGGGGGTGTGGGSPQPQGGTHTPTTGTRGSTTKLADHEWGATLQGPSSDRDDVSRLRGQQPNVLDRLVYARVGKGRSAPPLGVGPIVVREWGGNEVRDPEDRRQQLGISFRQLRNAETALQRIAANRFGKVDGTITADEIYRVGAVTKSLLLAVKAEDWPNAYSALKLGQHVRDEQVRLQWAHVNKMIADTVQAELDRQKRAEIAGYISAFVINPGVQIAGSAAGALI